MLHVWEGIRMKTTALGLTLCLASLSSAVSAQTVPAPPPMSMQSRAAMPAPGPGIVAPSNTAAANKIGLASSSYVLGPGDIIEVSVLGRPAIAQHTCIKSYSQLLI